MVLIAITLRYHFTPLKPPVNRTGGFAYSNIRYSLKASAAFSSTVSVDMVLHSFPSKYGHPSQVDLPRQAVLIFRHSTMRRMARIAFCFTRSLSDICSPFRFSHSDLGALCFISDYPAIVKRHNVPTLKYSQM